MNDASLLPPTFQKLSQNITDTNSAILAHFLSTNMEEASYVRDLYCKQPAGGHRDVSGEPSFHSCLYTVSGWLCITFIAYDFNTSL